MSLDAERQREGDRLVEDEHAAREAMHVAEAVERGGLRRNDQLRRVHAALLDARLPLLVTHELHPVDWAIVVVDEVVPQRAVEVVRVRDAHRKEEHRQLRVREQHRTDALDEGPVRLAQVAIGLDRDDRRHRLARLGCQSAMRRETSSSFVELRVWP